MASFMTRVELHNASSKDYETLHAAMEHVGFSRTIRSDDGHVYHLPTAEYICSGSFTRGQVLQSAKGAAGTTGKSFAVIVTESAGSTWSNLHQVR
jgi:hypothetical protein